MMVGDGVRLWCWSCVFYIQLLGDEGVGGSPRRGLGGVLGDGGSCLSTGGGGQLVLWGGEGTCKSLEDKEMD